MAPALGSVGVDAPSQPSETAEIYKKKAIQRTQDLIDRAGPDAFEVYSTRRQLLRYDDWYSEIASIDDIFPTLSEVLEILPKSKQSTLQ